LNRTKKNIWSSPKDTGDSGHMRVKLNSNKMPHVAQTHYPENSLVVAASCYGVVVGRNWEIGQY